MDVVSCPYFRYFSEVGCSQLTKISFDADDHVCSKEP